MDNNFHVIFPKYKKSHFMTPIEFKIGNLKFFNKIKENLLKSRNFFKKKQPNINT